MTIAVRSLKKQIPDKIADRFIVCSTLFALLLDKFK